VRFYTINGQRYPSVTTILNIAIAKPQLVEWAANSTKIHLKNELCGFRSADSYSSGELQKILDRSATAHKDILKAAGDRGAIAHKKIQDYAERVLKIQGDGRVIANSAGAGRIATKDPLIAAFQSWEASRQFQVIASERVIYSLEHKYAGTADLVGFIASQRRIQQEQQEFAVFDIKTSKHSYPEHKLQLAAYAIAISEMCGRLPHYCAVLHIPNPESDVPTITEVNSFTSAELFSLFKTFLAAKRLFDWLLTERPEQMRQQPNSPQKLNVETVAI
jgi:hypothetical protein